MLRGICATILALSLSLQTAMAGGVLVVGDSISAALGLEPQDGWVELLRKRLDEEGIPGSVRNASVSGDTTAGGLVRLPALLAEEAPRLLVIELGGNDGLRGQDPRQMQQNLSAMVEQGQAAGARVLLLGMRLPPNYGQRYNQRFESAYVEVAQQSGAHLLPFFMEGVAGVPGMMQADGIHPTAQGQPLLLENAWSLIRELLQAR